MGNRITRAALHLPPDEVKARMQAEPRPWRRRRWQIIWQALTAPRKAEDIARMVGVSVPTVHRLISSYKKEGVAAIETAGTGGRRNQRLTLAQEQAFLQPFLARVATGERVTTHEIQLAFEAETKQSVALSSIYRLLERHGWKQQALSASCAQSPADRPACANTGSAPQRRKPPASKDRPASKKIESMPQRTDPPSPEGKRQNYPSDLTEQEWEILKPLIPPAKPGGHPRTTHIQEVINAILYLDRTGGQWRALPHDFPPWSTVWSYFRKWRNDGTWKRIHTTLREQVRVKQGREPTPSAAIIDSQSVKTSQKGGFAAMMGERRSRDASATC